MSITATINNILLILASLRLRRRASTSHSVPTWVAHSQKNGLANLHVIGFAVVVLANARAPKIPLAEIERTSQRNSIGRKAVRGTSRHASIRRSGAHLAYQLRTLDRANAWLPATKLLARGRSPAGWAARRPPMVEMGGNDGPCLGCHLGRPFA